MGFRLNPHVQAVNSKLDAPAKKDYKFSGDTIDRINVISEHLQELQFQTRQEVERWDDSRSAKQLNKVLNIMMEQEEDIWVVEFSSLGYKLVDAYKNKDVGAGSRESSEAKKVGAGALKELRAAGKSFPFFGRQVLREEFINKKI